eukprot:TRINITY_DN42272_c0_g1_i1.p1 TRINITY_DN42272_c0_g1~~TRINITY_DN42272_c0_g1_i1.p1  ORF type:complete len:421 (-),score=54.19 TRINITY_DN42272_c0_g1_i1:27-1247(-)
MDKVENPGACLRYFGEVLLAWGQATFDTSMTPADLYNRAKDWSFEDLVERGAHAYESIHSFTLMIGLPCEEKHGKTREIRDIVSVSDEFQAAGYTFSVRVNSNFDCSGHVGVFLKPLSRAGFPDWWQCHCTYSLSTLGASRAVSGRQLFNTKKYFHQNTSAYGRAKFLSHEMLLASSSSELTLKTGIVVNSLLGFCSAFAFFHPSWWSLLHIDSLSDMLRLDCLPVESEDSLLDRLLSLGKEPHELDQLLKHLRWQFLTPGFLLNKCRTQQLRNCASTKLALRWLFVQNSSEQFCLQRRNAYAPEVVECLPWIESDAMIDWVLGHGGKAHTLEETRSRARKYVKKKAPQKLTSRCRSSFGSELSVATCASEPETPPVSAESGARITRVSRRQALRLLRQADVGQTF